MHFRWKVRLAGALMAGQLLVAAPAAAQQACPLPAGDSTGKLALVLSGGGAKGLAHIGVIRVLDSLGIRPDLVVGTSMGAIIGAMYASGYSGHEIDSLARAMEISSLFRHYEPGAPRALGPLQPLVVWEQGDRGFALQSAAVRETDINALVDRAMLRGNLLASGRFDSLPIPLRVVATDLATRRPVVLAGGDLAQAVRASFAIPLIFPPERIGGQWLADGGLSANIPIDAARQLGATRLIVVDATERIRDSLDYSSPVVLADRLLGFLFEQSHDSLGPSDLRIRPAVDGFPSLDFSRNRVVRLIELGRSAADSVLGPRAQCFPRAAAPAPSAPPARIGAVSLQRGTAADRRRLARVLELAPGDSLDPVRLRQRLTRMESLEEYRAVWLNPHRGPDGTVSFDLQIERAPRRVAGLGLAYDNELGGRMWAGLVDQQLAGLAAQGYGALFLGELRRELLVGTRWQANVLHRLFAPSLNVRLGAESVRQFDSTGEELSSIRIREAVGSAGVEREFDRTWAVMAGLEGRTWHEVGRRSHTVVGPTVRITKISRAHEQLFAAVGVWTPIYRRATVSALFSGSAAGFRLEPRFRLGWGEHLPPQLALALGGTDGFPGIHIGERLGDREIYGGILVSRTIRGPLVARLELAAGRSAVGGPLVDTDGWLAGVRVGLGADTPVGPVRFEYGTASNGRDAIFVRAGRWF